MKRLPMISAQAEPKPVAQTEEQLPEPPEYWRSLDHLAQKPEVRKLIEREFPEGADTIDAPTRRTFMSLMGASMALLGITGCVRRPEEKIIPYGKMPEHVVPGIPSWYATAFESRGDVEGILAESHEGRPTKVEGNKDHPQSLGGTGTQAQAHVLNLYDPDRVREFQKKTGMSFAPVKKAEFDKALEGALAKLGSGAGLRVLTTQSNSPARKRMLKALKARFADVQVVEYESASAYNTAAGTELAFKGNYRAHYDYSRARVIVAADSDFLGVEPGSTLASRQYAKTRRAHTPEAKLSRLYVAESVFTVTGMTADHRLAIPASATEAFLLSLGAELKAKGVNFGSLAGKFKASPAVDAKFVKALASDLAKNRGASIVTVGSRQAPAVHALAHAINAALGNMGRTVKLTKLEAPAANHVQGLKALAKEMSGGKVKALIILGGNPVYGAPADLGFDKALQGLELSVHLADEMNETAQLCKWVAPRAHELESWNDVRSADGTYSIVQPLIAPLFGGMTDAEFLGLAAAAKERRAYDIVRASFAEVAGSMVPDVPDSQPSKVTAPASSASASASVAASASASAITSASAAASGSAAVSASASGSAAPAMPPAAPPSANPLRLSANKAWRRALHDGIMRGSARSFVKASIDEGGIAAAVGKTPFAAPSSKALELCLSADPSLIDGRHANNPWLIEVPNPITKITWDNAAIISWKTAQDLGLSSGQVAKLSANGKTIEVAVWVVPGTVDGTVHLTLGWGRSACGRVGRGKGFNANKLRTSDKFYVAGGATLQGISRSYQIAVTQEHNVLENRPIVREGTIAEFKKDPQFAKKMVAHPPLKSLWTEREYKGHKWGMVIDLNTCHGCNTCVIACQAENNIPTVGKEQVTRQREMHWIRIDRYFKGDPNNPSVVTQPINCMQCENAPCENVCPVNATSHSPEGLNDMVYNRCVGTRYCSNNCPYKVRRFNFLDFREDVPETVKMVHNPNVSVRMRGTMEKCSYCVQRIQEGKIAAKREKRVIKDGDITTACAQACPTEAITFGDLNDKTSKVARMAGLSTQYAVLSELNTKPRTTYLAKIRNPNPELS